MDKKKSDDKLTVMMLVTAILALINEVIDLVEKLLR